MRCQLLGQLEHVLGRPFSCVVLPRPDPLGVVDGTRRGWFLLSRQWGMVTKTALGTGKVVQVPGQVELVHSAAVRANMRSILVAMMKSFSCSPLIFLVCSETIALPQPKLMFG
jgi:hypothetical protein